MGHSKRLMVAVTAAVLTLLVAAPPAWALPAIVVTPDDDLVHGQVVTVTGSGYTTGSTLFLAECTANPVTTSECDTRSLPSVTTDANGAFTTSFAARRVISTPTDGDVDCAGAPGACVLGVANSSLTEVATAPLSFDPDGPLPVPFEITVRDVTAAVRDNEVLLQGTVTCTEPARVEIQGRLRQVVRRRFIDGTFFTSVACEDEQPFSVVFEGENGIIKRGPADLDLRASGFADFRFDEFVVSAEIPVRSK